MLESPGRGRARHEQMGVGQYPARFTLLACVRASAAESFAGLAIRALCTGPSPGSARTRARLLDTARAASRASTGPDFPFLRRAARPGRFTSTTSTCCAGK
ncbi:hypothetical protein [Streptomyces sp. NPDC006134]|uniref:hypothetical protein n=1 Tax=Streptomyces sp. NPDC006134 TaxID=3154467 RepID=UPI0033FA3530